MYCCFSGGAISKGFGCHRRGYTPTCLIFFYKGLIYFPRPLGELKYCMYLCTMDLLRRIFGVRDLRANTPTSKLDNRTIRRIVRLSTYWCQENLGVNNRRSKPFKLSIIKQVSGPPCYGMFDEIDNKIYIFHNNCTSISLLVKTVLHEYTHYLQPIRKSYNKLTEEYGYDNHPMEIEAREMEGYYLNVWNKIKFEI